MRAVRLAWLCGSNTANLNLGNLLSLNLQAVSKSIGRSHKLLLTTPMVLIFEYKQHEVSLFSRGRLLIKNVKSEDEAREVFGAVAGFLGLE